MTLDEVEPARATRRRGAALEEAILVAAAAELAEVGYPSLTMDRVAARAGTSKNVLYRRWPSRAALSVAAYRHMLLSATPEEVPDTGDLRTDALTLLHQVNDRMSAPIGKILRGLLSGMQDDPDRLREIRDQLVSTSVSRWLTILAHAAARGEVRTDALTPRVATVAVDLLRSEYGLNGVTTVPESTLLDILDQVYLPMVQAHR